MMAMRAMKMWRHPNLRGEGEGEEERERVVVCVVVVGFFLVVVVVLVLGVFFLLSVAAARLLRVCTILMAKCAACLCWFWVYYM